MVVNIDDINHLDRVCKAFIIADRPGEISLGLVIAALRGIAVVLSLSEPGRINKVCYDLFRYSNM